MKALHDLLLGDSSHLETFKGAARDYFQSKDKKGGPIPRPVISHEVLRILKHYLDRNYERVMSLVIPIRQVSKFVVVCLEEFASNHEVSKPWLEHFEEVSQLVTTCLHRAWHSDSLKVPLTKKICHTIIYLGEKGELLCSALFNACAHYLLRIVVCTQDIDRGLQDVILEAAFTLSMASDPIKIADTYQALAKHLNYLSRKFTSLPCEAQASAYGILLKSITSKEQAVERAAVWFEKWPGLQKVFIDSYSKHFSEGCGQFLNELYELSNNPREWRKCRRTDQDETSCRFTSTSVLSVPMNNYSNKSKPVPTVGFSRKTKRLSQDVTNLCESFSVSAKRQGTKSFFPKSHFFSGQKYAPIPLLRVASKTADSKRRNFEGAVASLRVPALEAETHASKVSKWLESQPEQCDDEQIIISHETVLPAMEIKEVEGQNKTKELKNNQKIYSSASSLDFQTSHEGISRKWHSFKRGNPNVQSQQRQVSETDPLEEDMSSWEERNRDTSLDSSFAIPWHDDSKGSSSNEYSKKLTQHQQLHSSTSKLFRGKISTKSEKSMQLPHSPVYNRPVQHLNQWQKRLKELEESRKKSPAKLRSSDRNKKKVTSHQSKRLRVYDPVI